MWGKVCGYEGGGGDGTPHMLGELIHLTDSPLRVAFPMIAAGVLAYKAAPSIAAVIRWSSVGADIGLSSVLRLVVRRLDDGGAKLPRRGFFANWRGRRERRNEF